QKVDGRGPLNQEINRQSSSGRDGSYRMSRRIFERSLEVTCAVVANNEADLRDKIDYLNGLLNTNKEVPIMFSDETDVTYYGEYEGSPSWEDFVRHGQGVLPFVCYDPYKYYAEKTST